MLGKNRMYWADVIRAVVSAAVGVGLVAPVLLWLNGCDTKSHTSNTAAGSGSRAGSGASDAGADSDARSGADSAAGAGAGANAGGTLAGGSGGDEGPTAGGNGGNSFGGAGGETAGSGGSAPSAGSSGRAPGAGSGGSDPSAGSGGSDPSAGSGGSAPSAGSGGDISSDVCPPDIALPALCRLCADGSCGRAVCKDGEFTGSWVCPEDEEPTVDCDCALGAYTPVCGVDGQTYDATCGRNCVPVAIACNGECPCSGCIVGGCSRELCVDADQEPPISTCEWRPEYACYDTATCERQTDGNCGWTSTPELTRCLAEAAAGSL